MKKGVFVLILMFGNTGFSQQIDSLYIGYDIGYDCSYTIQSETMRGGCGKKEKMDYSKRRQVYRIESFISQKMFRQWEGKFVSDSIVDSIEKVSSFKNRKIPVKRLDQFLRTICSIQSDTVFSYSKNDIPERFFRNNSITRKNCDSKQIDSLLQDSFSSVSFSTVTGYLCIYFKVEGMSYVLTKDSNNDYWSIFWNGLNKRFRFIYFAFDAFLLNELPKKFSGIEVLD